MQLVTGGLLIIIKILQVLASTDHINSCKPVNKNDPSYADTLAFLEKILKSRLKESES